MHIDLRGRINNTKLSYRKCLLPVFEAIVNSMHSIEETGRRDGRIDIYIKRDTAQQSIDGEPIQSQPIVGFVIKDNGVGFNDKNFAAFQTSDTTNKAAKGGKGVGRFLWLKAFDRAKVNSVYEADSEKHRRRAFEFALSEEGIENLTDEVCEEVKCETTVSLEGFKADYRKYCVKTIESTALRIIEHCLESFVLNACPKMVLHDEYEGTSMDLKRTFKNDMCLDSKRQTFKIKGHKFKITHVRLVPGREQEHAVSFCANERSVKAESLTTLVSNLEKELTDDSGEQNQQFIYAGYVSGPFLDDRVVPERTHFDLMNEEPDLEFPDELSWPELLNEAAVKSQDYLAPFTKPVGEAKREWIRRYIENIAPQYRPLLKHRPGALDKIPADLTDDKLDIELYKIDQQYDADLRIRYQKLLAEGDGDAQKHEDHKKKFEQFLEEWNEAGMSKLARHVAFRKATLAFLDERLGLQEDNKYSLEESVHEVIFPLRSTSDDIRPDQMNLWILDEKLAYHYYLASDKRFDQMGEAVEIDSGDRPDIAIFNRPFAFTESDPIGSVVLVEFKRPARDDYTEKDGKNPITQVYDYVKLIKSGKAKDRRGRPLTIPDSLPFYAYIVCDITPSLSKQAEYAQLTPTPDSRGFFGYHGKLGVYVEIVSFDKLIDDAKKRNAILFDKLGVGAN